MDRETLIRCEMAEAAAFASIYRNTRPEVAKKLGVGLLPIGSTWAGKCDALNDPLYNRCNGLGLLETFGDEEFDQLAAFFGNQNWAVEIAPIAHGVDEERLWRRGMVRGEDYPKFIRSTSVPLPKPDPRVRELSVLDFSTFARVAVEAFKMPPAALEWFLADVPDEHCHYFLAELLGQPAGTAFLYTYEGVGWLGAGCVLPDFRGQGLQRALIEARIRKAAAEGCEWVTSETGADKPDSPNYSCRNMLACGFEVAYERTYAKFVPEIN
ncbi:MAG: GNAT family N-acetyltransferase [Armatimonadetes bacterium]|nr:GNAT family N-acetyltransferase [Armatimonadota bacterium]